MRDEERKRKLSRAAKGQKFVEEASAVIAGVSTDPNYTMSCGIPADIVDLSIALDHLSLKAAEEGLGTCWIGAFDQEKAKEVLGVPGNKRIISLMTLGYPSRELEKSEKDRKDLDEVLSYGSFQKE